VFVLLTETTLIGINWVRISFLSLFICQIIRERHVQSLHLGYTDREICRQFVLIINDLMVSRAANRESIREEDEPGSELRRLREIARLAAIHYNGEKKFQKRTDLSHVVHASLHFAQLVRDRTCWKIYIAWGGRNLIFSYAKCLFRSVYFWSR